MNSAPLKSKSEERRRAWLAQQSPAVAAERLSRVASLVAEYDAYEGDESSAWADENMPLYTAGDLVSRLEENIARAADVTGCPLPIDAGTLAAWIAQLPTSQRTTLPTLPLKHLTPALVHAHLLTLDLHLEPALARAIARRVVLVLLNKRNSSPDNAGSQLRGPFWLVSTEPTSRKKPRAEAKRPDPEPAKPTPPPPTPARSVQHGPLLYTIIDSPDGPVREMCFACGADPSRAIKRRINVQPFQAVTDTAAMLVDFLVKAKELAQGAPSQTACDRCGASLSFMEKAPDVEQDERLPERSSASEKQREVIGRIRITKDLRFHINGKFCTLEAGTECSRLRMSGKEMFPPQGEEQAGILWEGRLRSVPVSAVEVLEAEA